MKKKNFNRLGLTPDQKKEEFLKYINLNHGTIKNYHIFLCLIDIFH